jgi:aryl-alcohol dehydrogenase-like predicted oxidoreductase
VSRARSSSAIIGPRTVEQLEDNLTAEGIDFGPEQLKDLDRASRGPMSYAVFLQRGR